MDILEPIKERDIVDYDFMFVGGAKLAITLDPEAGDTVNEYDTHYELHTVARPNPTNPEDSIDAETVKVFKNQLAVLATCWRKQRMPSEEEKREMEKFIHELAKGVQ
jgi:hypothetical protein